MATDNSNLEIKIKLREYFVSLIDSPVILETHAGETRQLYHACYEKYNTTSLDIKSIKGVIKCDNKKYIASENMSRYNIFDIDAYGDPYTLFVNIVHRMSPHQKKVFFLTDGLHRNLIYGSCPGILLTAMNNPKNIDIPCLNRHHEHLIKQFLQKICKEYSLKVYDCKIARDESVNKMLYIALFCEKT